MPAMSPRRNGDLAHALDLARAAWGDCAARVDLVVACQAHDLADALGGNHE